VGEQEQEQKPKKIGRKQKIVTEEQELLLERKREERALRKQNKKEKEERLDDDRSENWEYDCTAAFFSTPHWWQPPHLAPAVDFTLLPRLPHHFFPSLSSRQIDYLFCVADDEIEASADTNDFYYHHAVTYAQQRRKRKQEQEHVFEEQEQEQSFEKQEQVAKDRRHVQHMLQFVIRQRIDKWPNDLRTIDLLFLLLRDLRIPYSIPDMSLISRQPTMADMVPSSDSPDS
jgi:hypothetical protein